MEIGDYLIALKDWPHGGKVLKGSWGKITGIRTDSLTADFPEQAGYAVVKDLEVDKFTLVSMRDYSVGKRVAIKLDGDYCFRQQSEGLPGTITGRSDYHGNNGCPWVIVSWDNGFEYSYPLYSLDLVNTSFILPSDSKIIPVSSSDILKSHEAPVTVYPKPQSATKTGMLKLSKNRKLIETVSKTVSY